MIELGEGVLGTEEIGDQHKKYYDPKGSYPKNGFSNAVSHPLTTVDDEKSSIAFKYSCI